MQKIKDFLEKLIIQLKKDSTSTKINPYYFKIIITTGRGRIDWLEKILEDNILKNYVIFKAVESILSALDYGLAIDDDFQIKYNLTKVLLGS